MVVIQIPIRKACPCNIYLSYRKTGACMGILIFAPKHKLWVQGVLRVPTIYVLSKNKKNIKFFPVKIFIFTTTTTKKKKKKLDCMEVFS